MALPPIRLKNFPSLASVLASTSIYGYNAANDNDVQFSVTTLATYLSTLYATLNHTHADASGSAAGFMSASNFTKLSGVAIGATANSSDAFLLSRGNHTGSQASSTISDFNSAVRAQLEAALAAGSNVAITPSGSGALRILTIAATGGSGGGGIRNQATATINLATGASGNVDITLKKTVMIQAIGLNQAGTVVVYDSVASRTADSGRSLSTPPANEAGVIAQVAFTGAATLKRTVPASNMESPITYVFPLTVVNSGASGDVTVTIDFFEMES